MAHKVLIFGTDSLYPKLKPLYDAEVERGNLDIVAVVDDVKTWGGVMTLTASTWRLSLPKETYITE